ncbi:hypothetical protein J2Z38_001034 [Anaerococcus degeneri]|nr:hypothetical protein [Anaerococcus degeneri]
MLDLIMIAIIIISFLILKLFVNWIDKKITSN